MNKPIFSLVIGTVVALLASGTSFGQGSDGSVFVPVELFACQYHEGKGPQDLDAAVAAWTEYMDKNGSDTYAAWTLEKYYHGPEQDFDVLWVGAWKDANVMGAGTDSWLANGGAVRAEFASVVHCSAHANYASINPVPPTGGRTPESGVFTFSDCSLKEGVRGSDLRASMAHWGQALKDAGLESGIFHWYPVFGGGDTDFTFKQIRTHANHTALGKFYETMSNGGLYRKHQELFDHLLECDVARVYNAKNRRQAQLR